MKKFVVIDTETNWRDEIMSIGAVIADAQTFRPVESKYYVIAPEYLVGGMFSSQLLLKEDKYTIKCGRAEAIADLLSCFERNEAFSVFAYNACFDHRHLPELSHLDWYDIIRLAAYRQYNPKIPDTAECYCTGRLKRGYSVETMLRLLSDDPRYFETHNALLDALDELNIMALLRHSLEAYIKL